MQIGQGTFAFIVVLWLIAGCASTTLPAAQPGDDLLALTQSDNAPVSAQQVEKAIAGLFAHLNVPRETQNRFTTLTNVRVQTEDEFFEVSELSNVIIVAKRGVKIGFANNVVIIGAGEVSIAHATNLFVAAAGNVEIGHDGNDTRNQPSFIVSNGKVKISFAIGSSIYATKGAELSHAPNVTLYNTDVLAAGHAQVAKQIREPIFLQEARRVSDPPSLYVSSGEPFDFSGQRCTAGWKIDDLASQVPRLARREANCMKVESIVVACEQEAEEPNFESREAWTIGLCGKKLLVVTTASGLRPKASNAVPGLRSSSAVSGGSINVRSTEPHANTKAIGGRNRSAPAVMTSEQSATVRTLTAQGRKAMVDRDFQGAINAYGEMIKVAPNFEFGYVNRAHAKQRVGDLSGALADVDKAIGMGPGPQPGFYWLQRAPLRLALGDASGALADYDQAVGEANSSPIARLNRAVAYLHLGRFQEAIGECDREIQISTNKIHCYETRAWAHLLLGNSDNAYKDAFSALAETEGPANAEQRKGRGGHWVLAGYLSLLQAAKVAQAREWLGQWKDVLADDVWPGIVLSHFRGEIDAPSLELLASSELERQEMRAYLGAYDHVRGYVEASRVRFTAILEGSKGYSLPRALAERGMSVGAAFR